MRKAHFISPVLLLVLFCASCQKSTRKYYPLSAAAKELATLKPSSFLVFVDSLHPSVRDSLIVTNYENYKAKDDRDPYNVVEWDYVGSTLEGSLTKYTIYTYGSTQYQSINITYYGADFHSSITENCATLPPTINVDSGSNFKRGVVKYFDSIMLNNTMYYKVYKSVLIIPHNNYLCYFNNSNALIRLEQHTDTVDHLWQQVNAQILK